ncbi:MAG: hypothetical protein QXI16_00295, partial [Sulfolobaceae archaeon]
ESQLLTEKTKLGTTIGSSITPAGAIGEVLDKTRLDRVGEYITHPTLWQKYGALWSEKNLIGTAHHYIDNELNSYKMLPILKNTIGFINDTVLPTYSHNIAQDAITGANELMNSAIKKILPKGEYETLGLSYEPSKLAIDIKNALVPQDIGQLAFFGVLGKSELATEGIESVLQKVLIKGGVFATANTLSQAIDNLKNGNTISDGALESAITGFLLSPAAEGASRVFHLTMNKAIKPPLNVLSDVLATKLADITDKAATAANLNPTLKNQFISKAYLTALKISPSILKGLQADTRNKISDILTKIGNYDVFAKYYAYDILSGIKRIADYYSKDIIRNYGDSLKLPEELVNAAKTDNPNYRDIFAKYKKDFEKEIFNSPEFWTNTISVLDTEGPNEALMSPYLRDVKAFYKEYSEENPLLKAANITNRELLKAWNADSRSRYIDKLDRAFRKEFNNVNNNLAVQKRLLDKINNYLKKSYEIMQTKEYINQSELDKLKAASSYISDLLKRNKNNFSILKNVNTDTLDKLLDASKITQKNAPIYYQRIIKLLNNITKYEVSDAMNSKLLTKVVYNKVIYTLDDIKNYIQETLIRDEETGNPIKVNEDIEAVKEYLHNYINQFKDLIGVNYTNDYIIKELSKIKDYQDVIKLINTTADRLNKNMNDLIQRKTNRLNRLLLENYKKIENWDKIRDVKDVGDWVSRATTPIGSTKERRIKDLFNYIALKKTGIKFDGKEASKMLYNTYRNATFIPELDKFFKEISKETTPLKFFYAKMAFDKSIPDVLKEKIIYASNKIQDNLKMYLDPQSVKRIMSYIETIDDKDTRIGLYNFLFGNGIGESKTKLYNALDGGRLGYLSNFGGLQKIANILMNGKLEGDSNSIISSLIKFTIFSKRFLLSFSAFHLKSLIFSALYGMQPVNAGIESIFMNPTDFAQVRQAYVRKIEKFIADNPDASLRTTLQRSIGMTNFKDIDEIFNNIYGSKFLNTFKNASMFMDKAMWERFYVIQKLDGLSNAIDRFKIDGDMDKLRYRTDQLNVIYGGHAKLSLELDPNMKSFLRLMVFAPDWLYTLFRQQADALTAKDINALRYVTNMLSYTIVMNNSLAAFTGNPLPYNADFVKNCLKDPTYLPNHLNDITTTETGISGHIARIDTLSYEREIFGLLVEPFVALYQSGFNKESAWNALKEFMFRVTPKLSLGIRLISALNNKQSSPQDLFSLLVPYSLSTLPNQPSLSQKITSGTIGTTILSSVGFRSYELSAPKAINEAVLHSNAFSNNTIQAIQNQISQYMGNRNLSILQKSLATLSMYNIDPTLSKKLSDEMQSFTKKAMEDVIKQAGPQLAYEIAFKSKIYMNDPKITKLFLDYANGILKQNRNSWLMKQAYNILLTQDPDTANYYLINYMGLEKPNWNTKVSSNLSPEQYGTILTIAFQYDPIKMANIILSEAQSNAHSTLTKQIM